MVCAAVLAAGGLVVAAAITSAAPVVATASPIAPVTSTTAADPDDSDDLVPIEPATRLISAFDAKTAWRTTIGDCSDDDVVVERSVDGGGTWDGFNLGSAGGITGAIALQALGDDNSATVIGQNTTGCTPTWVETTSAGTSWTAYSDRTATAWYVDTTSLSLIHTPGAVVRPAPCDVAGLASLSSTSAAVLCTDRSLHRTVDGGLTWTTSKTVPAALAVGASTDGYLVASQSRDVSCTGLTIWGLPESPTTDPATVSSCVPTASSTGEVALSGTSEALWLWAGTVVLRSLDEGATWR